MNGNSQALRIPKAFRIDAQRVSITRTEQGDLLVRPLPDSPEERADKLMAALLSFDDLAQADREAIFQELETDKAHPLPDQERDSF